MQKIREYKELYYIKSIERCWGEELEPFREALESVGVVLAKTNCQKVPSAPRPKEKRNQLGDKDQGGSASKFSKGACKDNKRSASPSNDLPDQGKSSRKG